MIDIMVKWTDFVIVGAGPYGLSLAAHLSVRGVDFQIFGSPMAVWRSHMPSGMHLKSEGFASDIFDPLRLNRLRDFCRRHGHAYADVGVPIPVEVFHAYGREFQQRLLPDLDTRHVARITASQGGFLLRLDDGEIIRARRVVIAVGITHYAYLPPELRGLPPQFVSHTSESRGMKDPAGRKILVLGGGSSAVDSAGLLHQAGADVEIVTRRPKIWFNHPPDHKRGLELAYARLLKPRSGLGLGWRSRMASDLPTVFHRMPEPFRLRVTRGHLGPAAGWVSRTLVEGKVPIRINLALKHALVRGEKVAVTFVKSDGGEEEMVADHVVAGTGYRVDINRLDFLDETIRARISEIQNTPRLTRFFESSVPGLYFVGPSAANSFGPLLRFAWGAKFTSKHLTPHFAR
ncbi:NAD(P)-binding domain-containing protein [Nguyenibacter vanlangensis]|uniref:NAD(P)-binding domain-containing protein n=1 Tax=Nguyenibacter vanlangensis TaxID=1216886 RepID=A0ABZ3D8C0_9PROT